MGIYIIRLLLSLFIILFSCELFTNAIEWFGSRMKVGDGVLGSIFSAVGTCLPETMIPLIAILFTSNREYANDIGVGAIIGAPFMLATLAFFVSGISLILFSRKRKYGMTLHADKNIIKRDLEFFLFLYPLALFSSLFECKPVKNTTGFVLIGAYVYYVYITLRNDRFNSSKPHKLYILSILNLFSFKKGGNKSNPRLRFIFLQLGLSLASIVLGAEIFIKNVESIAVHAGIPAMILSLIIAPVATELPEKFNSVIWMARQKDTLAIANITGAMVFQSCLPVAFGIFATPWKLDLKAILSGILALTSTFIFYISFTSRKKTNAIILLNCGIFYIVFILYVLNNFA